MKKTEGFRLLKSEFFQGFENWLPSGDGLSFPSLFISYERELIGGINWPLNGSLTFFFLMHKDLLLCAKQHPGDRKGPLTQFSWSDATRLLASQQECSSWERGQHSPPEAVPHKTTRTFIQS